MPAVRCTRRSGRLSNRPPTEPNLEPFDDGHDALLHPEDHVYAHATPASGYSTPLRSDSELRLSLPPSPISDDAGDASFASRPSHGRKKKDGHIPRPPNAFMIFRSFLWSQIKDDPDGPRDHREISRSAGLEWRLLGKQGRKSFEEEAKVKKAEHEKMYPGYRYAPVSKREVKKRRSVRDTRAEAARARVAADRVVRNTFGSESRTELGTPKAAAPSTTTRRKRVHTRPLRYPPRLPGPLPQPTAPHASVEPEVCHLEMRPSPAELEMAVSPAELEVAIAPAELEHEPELVAPCSTAGHLDAHGFDLPSEIPHLDLSVSVYGFPAEAPPVSSIEFPLDASSLFCNMLNECQTDYTQLYTNTVLSFDQGSSLTPLDGSPYALGYSLDNGSDSTQSPTSGLLSSDPTWSHEMNSWVLPDFDFQLPLNV